MSERNYLIQIFFHKAHHITNIFHKYLWLRTLDSTSTLCIRAILNSEVTIKTHKNAGNVALNRLQIGRIYSMSTETRTSPCSAGNMLLLIRQLKYFSILYTLLNDCRSTVNIDLALETSFSKYMSSQITESVNNENQRTHIACLQNL